MFGAYGKALQVGSPLLDEDLELTHRLLSFQDPSGLLTLRALDWDVDGPFRNFAELTIYHAQNANENTFLNVSRKPVLDRC
jgi:hypothetical protein